MQQIYYFILHDSLFLRDKENKNICQFLLRLLGAQNIFSLPIDFRCNTLYVCVKQQGTTMKEEIVTIRMDEELKKELQKLADKDERNLSDYIRLILKRFIEKNKNTK